MLICKRTIFIFDGYDKAIDHIFVSNKLDVIDKGVFDVEELTDHKGVYARIRI